MDRITEQLWQRGEMSFLLHEAQREVYNKILKSHQQLHLFLGSRQFGKSFLSLALGFQHVANPNTVNKLVKIAAGTLKATNDIVNDNMKFFIDSAPRGHIRPTKSDKRFKVGTQGEIRLGMMERAHVDSLRGGNAGLYILEEAAAAVSSDDFEYAYKAVIIPQLLRSGGKIVIITTPSKNPDHYVHSVLQPQCKKLGTLYKATIYDNPQLTTDQIQNAINAYGGVDSLDFRREYLCEIVRDGRSLIIPAFSDVKHLTNEGFESVFTACCWIVGDTGGIRDKHVLQVWGHRITDYKKIILEEVVFESNTNTIVLGDTIKLLQTKYQVKSYHIFLDCHGQTQVDLGTLCNVHVTLPPKVDRDNAIMALNSAFFQEQIVINNSCEFTIKSLRSCMFNKTRTDFERTDELGHADAVMCAVYGLRVEKFIERPKIITNASNFHQMNHNTPQTNLEKVTKALKPFHKSLINF
jgi:hypothetical protein